MIRLPWRIAAEIDFRFHTGCSRGCGETCRLVAAEIAVGLPGPSAKEFAFRPSRLNFVVVVVWPSWLVAAKIMVMLPGPLAAKRAFRLPGTKLQELWFSFLGCILQTVL